MAAPPPPLLELLSNEYLLLATTPYLLPHELYALSRTSRSFHSLLTHSRSVYRHLHRPPLRMLSLAPIIRDVKTLVLDGAAVTVDDLHRLLAAPYRIALLSLRACNAINQRQLMLLLQYLFRPDRAPDATSLRGIYLFGAPSDEGNPGNIVTQPGWTWRAECAWDPAWASTLRACEGACVFDAALCGGCDGAAVALVRLAGGCAGCGGGGGGAAETGEGGKGIVLVPPVPLTSSDVRVACRGGATGTVMRCGECLERRHCSLCRTWWCASCVADSAGGGKVRGHAMEWSEGGIDAVRSAAPMRLGRLLRVRARVRRLRRLDCTRVPWLPWRLLPATVRVPRPRRASAGVVHVLSSVPCPRPAQYCTDKFLPAMTAPTICR